MLIVNVQDLRLDPERFQSANPKAREAHSDLSDVHVFNPDLAGLISIWLDPLDQCFYVVDGHRRVSLARRTGEASLAAHLLDYPTDTEALLSGAMTNIAQMINYPTRRLKAICCRLTRIEAALDSDAIPANSPVWNRVLDTVPELAELVHHCNGERHG